jgi:hypothetical protein
VIVVVTLPALALGAPPLVNARALGRSKLAWLIMLKISARNVPVAVSRTLKVFSSEKSKSASPGPITVFLTRFPYVPASGSENIDAS